MNKIQLICCGVGLMLTTASAILIQTEKKPNSSFLKMKSEYSEMESEEIQGAKEYYRKMLANQITGEIDARDVQAAKDKMNQMFDPSFKKSRSFLNMKWEETGPNNVGGRTRIMLTDKNNSNKIYMGAVGGGFWISLDNGNSWTKRNGNDSSTAIAVSSITQAANGDIYYGTGEGIGGWAGVSFGPQIFQLGEGIYKSTDGGTTFTRLTSTIPANLNSAGDPWSYVDRLAADPNNADRIFAATYGGLKVTNNGGTTWAKPSTLTANSHFKDVKITTDGSKVFAATSSNLYVSNDGGVTFGGNIMGTNGLPTSGQSQRIEIALAPSDPNYAYVTVAAPSGALKGVYKSTDGGQNWTSIALGGSAIFNPLGNQGDYDIAFGVHPTNKDMVFLGGQLELYRYTPSNGWETIAYWIGSSGSGSIVHADMHCIAFNPSNPNNMYVTNDGGFYRTFDCTVQTPVFAEKNKNYSVTQCYGIAANILGYVMFGSQDNGSGMMGQEVNSKQESRDLTGGDGTRCAMSDYNRNFIFSSVVNGELRRASDGGLSGSSFKSFFDKNIDNAAPAGEPDNGAGWVAPICFKEKQVGTKIKSVFLFGTNSSVWMTQGAMIGNPVWFNLFNPGAVHFSAVTMSEDGNTVYAATETGTVYRIKVPNLWDSVYHYADTLTNMPGPGPYTFPYLSSCVTSNIVSYGGRFVTDLETTPSGDVLLVTLANYSNSAYIYKSTNATDPTPTFSDITSNLPKMPIYTSLCVGKSSTKFMIGSDLGIWGTENGGGTWTELNVMNSDPATWHPRVATYEILEKDLFMNEALGSSYQGPVIYTGTHGRGTFRSTSMASFFPTQASLIGQHSGTITVYPNPASDVFNIAYDAVNSSKVLVQIYSLHGSLVRSQWINTIAGKNEIPMNVSNLPSGGYIVYLNDDGKKASSTIIKK